MKSDAQLRYEAEKQGYTLKKSRAGYSADNQGGYMIVKTSTGIIEAGEHFDMSAEDVERFLSQPHRTSLYSGKSSGSALSSEKTSYVAKTGMWSGANGK